MRALGIVLPTWVGDTTMATPLLRALAQHLPGTERVAIGRPVLRRLLEPAPWLDRWIDFDRSLLRNPLDWLRQVQTWRNANLDAVVLLRGGPSANIIARLAQIPRRIGFAHHRYRNLLNEPIEVNSSLATRDLYLRVLSHLVGCDAENRRLELHLDADDVRRAGRLASQFPDRLGPLVSLQPGSGSKLERRWPASRFAQLARHLALKHRARVLVLGSVNELPLARSIARQADSPRVQAVPEHLADIGSLKVCLHQSRLLVTNDTGPRHIAAAFETPTLVLFGPTRPESNDNGNPREAWIVARQERERAKSPSDGLQAIALERVCRQADRLLQAGLEHPATRVPQSAPAS